MNLQIAISERVCSQRSEIAAFIDGELAAREEMALEIHFAKCTSCARELNEQKKLLCALDFALECEREEIALPVNFTKVVVANAESKVSGLRHPKERFNTLFVCAALFLLTLLSLGSDTEIVLNTFINFAEQIFAVAGFVTHLIYDIGIGTIVVLRSLSLRFVFGSAASTSLLIALFVVSLLTFSRLINRFNRA